MYYCHVAPTCVLIQSGLPSQEERERFERYKTALPSTTTPPSSRLQLIIAIDQDARLISPSHPLILLLNKFGALGFQGQLLWLSGGFQALLALAQEPGSAHWATTLLISEQQHQHHNITKPTTPMSLSIPLPLSASLPTPPTINPFFDNIRQLNERLSLDSSLQNLSPIELPELTNPVGDLPRLPPFLRRLLQDSPIQRAQRLAHEFHDLEMAEQHRLEDVMRWESSRLRYLSKSINRYKNIWPYEHTRIRLRSGQARRNETDYMNASMISFRSDGAPPLLSSTSQHQVGSRRYIATQGPLTSTFEDFWSVVGSEDVGLIIMITRRHEAGREKCADYLRNGQYGDLVVSVDLPPPSRSCTTTDGDGGDGGGTGMESDGDEEREMASGFFGFDQLCDCVTGVAPIWQTYPIMAVVNEMREQRMSMVANYRQYVFLHEVLLTYLLKELDISVVGASSAGPTGRVPGAPEIGGLSSNDEHVPKPGHPSASRARGSPSHDPTKEAGTDSIGPSGILRCLSPSVASSATSTLPSHSASSEASSDLDIDPLGSRPARSPANLSAAPSAGDYFF
ncbi:hypothetical protein PtB15_7B579 [Puccinia triticina]|nr:hypothetical protein PtB15_7B579 [Puccinia triticina]